MINIYKYYKSYLLNPCIESPLQTSWEESSFSSITEEPEQYSELIETYLAYTNNYRGKLNLRAFYCLFSCITILSLNSVETS